MKKLTLKLPSSQQLAPYLEWAEPFGGKVRAVLEDLDADAEAFAVGTVAADAVAAASFQVERSLSKQEDGWNWKS